MLVAVAVWDVVIISSPFLIPILIRAHIKASVPLFVETTNFEFRYFESFVSKEETFEPKIYFPDFITLSI